ncbi:MAG: hypothetical protein IMW91_10505 [Firmicutes bacterium]|nr:hypothetical protein [Bacillota bacterium]
MSDTFLQRITNLGTGQSARTAPPLHVPMRFFASAIVFFLAGAVVLLVTASRLPSIPYLALHLWTVGGGMMLVVGALTQIVTVAYHISFASTRWLSAIWWAIVMGAVALAVGFSLHVSWLQGIAGALLAVALLGYALLLMITFRQPHKTQPCGRFIAISATSLAVVALLGIGSAVLSTRTSTLVFHHFPAIHALIGLGGAFGSLIVGISYQLFPLFARTKRPAQVHPSTTFALVVAALICGVTALTLSPGIATFTVQLLALLLGTVTLTVWLLDLERFLSLRREAEIDFALANQQVAAVHAGVAVLTGVAAAVLQWTSAPLSVRLSLTQGAGTIFWLGFVMASMLGWLFKILPFLLYMARYQPYYARREVPVYRTLYRQERGQLLLLIWYLATWLLAIASVAMHSSLADIGAALVLVTLIGFIAAQLWVFSQPPAEAFPERTDGHPALHTPSHDS